MRTTADNTTPTSPPFNPMQFQHEFLGVFTDFRVWLFALEHQNEMDEGDRVELPNTGERLSVRLELLLRQFEGTIYPL